MEKQLARRKPNGVSALLTVRYPAHEIEVLEAAARAAGVTRSTFIYEAVAKEVRRTLRKAQIPSAA